ncbi:phage minor capsid protein [Bacillus subtilis]|uniref:phage minor capsid protein n=1 Tax=Bacillus subtilis TaxID=1423 RepID=UPI00129EACF0|nr:phage minor capsid protein [Bacillus subtilis]NRF03073.1 minor capsid protein [Bacillus subtilis]NRG37217.1 minor capsid protein [Bacillus subtilis]QGI31267.1 minor capsid protein [Bacillus subtilis]WHX51923.1 minor capsid protein [Bacillus subtilis]WHX55924.1 minor capsid protein [Bacillus subtilis]
MAFIPTPKYDRDKKRMAKMLSKQYKQMFDYLLLQLQFNPDDPKVIREAQIMRQINYWLKELDQALYKEIEKLIKKSFQDGQAYHLLSVKEAKNWEEAVSSASFNKLQRARIKAIVADTHGDILQATNNTSSAIKSVVRQTVSKVAQYHSLNNGNYKDMQKGLLKQLSKQGLSKTIVKEGFVGIKDRAGRKWDLATYSKMVVTTKTNQAFIEGVTHESEETGFDLAVITDHGAEDACKNWEGLVISLTGKTKGYITYKQAKATNEIFHPNCEHGVHSIRSLDMLPADEIAQHRRKMAQIGSVESRKYVKKRKKKAG